jgi:hypothetical protein
MNESIFHIREKLAKRGGNQFYRDRSVRTTATLCGAPITEFDVLFHEKAETWNEHVPCAKCIEIRRAR